MTPPPGNTRAGPPAELLKSSQRLTTWPFMSMTSTACVCSGESTVNPFHDLSGSYIVVPVGYTDCAAGPDASAHSAMAVAHADVSLVISRSYRDRPNNSPPSRTVAFVGP